jgi:hypothetical protein
VIHRGALILVASLLGACGDSAPESTRVVAGVAELIGPYQPEPFQAFDPALVMLLQDACLNDFAGEVRLAEGLRPVLVDGRGGGRFMVLLAAPNGQTDCIGQLDASGEPIVEGGGSSRERGGIPLIEPRAVEPGGSGSGSGVGIDNYSYVTGRVGAQVGGVVLELGDSSRVTASVGGGRYAAWWPGAHQVARILAYDQNGALVGESPP